MNVIISEQIKLFIIFFTTGIIIGVLFDIFRIIRKAFKISDMHTCIEDIIFGVLTGILLIFVIFIYNNGSLRFYMILGMALGIITYLFTVSKYFIKINVKIIKFIQKIILKLVNIILVPIKFLKGLFAKTFNKPFTLLIINIKKIKNKLLFAKKREKHVKKEGF